MTATEARQTFGDTIICTYYNGTDFVTGEFRYNKVLQQSPYNVDSASGSYTFTGDTWIEYKSNFSSDVVANPQYITLDIQPTYSIFDTTQIHTAIALSTLNDISASAYQSPSWDWLYNGITHHIENNDTSANGDFKSRFTLDGYQFTYVCADLSSAASVSGYSYRAVFCGNTKGSGSMYLEIAVPYVDIDSSGETGTFTSVSGSSGTGSSVDLSPTNTILEEQTGILQQIKQAIQGFFDTIKNALVAVFVPSSDFMDDFKDDMQDLLEDHLGGLYQAISKIDDIFTGFSTVTSKQTIHINAVNIPLAGETLTLGNWDVPLKRDELSILYDGIAFIIDFLATAAFLNMCRNKLEIFLNPDSEVITE